VLVLLEITGAAGNGSTGLKRGVRGVRGVWCDEDGWDRVDLEERGRALVGRSTEVLPNTRRKASWALLLRKEGQRGSQSGREAWW